MGYQSTSIDSIVRDVNHSYLIPAIQREFVWDKSQILDLFDSVLRGYPIGSFFFWRVSGEYAKNRIKYKFVKNYIEDPIYPSEISDVTYHNKRYRDKIVEPRPPNRINLVLDGQQRITSFYLGLKGTFTTKARYKRRKRRDSWDKKQLYLNLLSPTTTEKNDRKYQFQFKQPEPAHSKSEYWYRVGDILEVNESTEEVERILGDIRSIEAISTERARGVVNKNINKLYMAIKEREVISYFEETEESQDKVLQMFIRANEGGSELKRSDILLSIATAHWSGGSEEIVAREEIQTLVDELNEHNARGSKEFDSNSVLRALMLNADVTSIAFSMSNFNETTLRKMKETWLDSEFKQSMTSTLDLLNSFGFTTSSVRSKTLLLPVIYYFYHNDNPTLSYNSERGRETRQKLLYWICSMVATGDLNTKTLQTVQATRNIIQEGDDNQFPVSAIEEKLHDYNKSMGFDEETLDRWFTDKHTGTLRVVLSLLYFPDVANENYEYELDHIFPKSKLTTEYLTDEVGLKHQKAEQITELSKSLANVQLLRRGENRRKSDTLPYEWLSSRTDEYLDQHCIPQSSDHYALENAEQFFHERKQLIRDKLLSHSPDRERVTNSTVQTALDD